MARGGPGVLALAALVGLMVSAAVLTWRARGARRVGVLALHVLLVGGALLGIYTAVVRDLFGDTVEDDLALPDGRHAYLYRGFFCARVVRIAEPWALFTREALTQASTCEVSARLAWDADAGQVRVLGPDGEPLPPPEPLRLFPVR